MATTLKHLKIIMPLVMYFHTSPYADPFDPIIVATYAMLAAEALGLGSCMIGTPAQFNKYSKRLKRKNGITIRNQQGIVDILGYPQVKYQRAIKRRLAHVRFHESASDQRLHKASKGDAP